jgi:hypothetical protein
MTCSTCRRLLPIAAEELIGFFSKIFTAADDTQGRDRTALKQSDLIYVVVPTEQTKQKKKEGKNDGEKDKKKEVEGEREKEW